jgi:hypothetical protein
MRSAAMTFFRSEMLYGKFLILLALTALFIFLSSSGSFCGEAEDEYHGFYVVSSYKNFNDAAALADRLRAQGYDPFCKIVMWCLRIKILMTPQRGPTG